VPAASAGRPIRNSQIVSLPTVPVPPRNSAVIRKTDTPTG
jgi:hypothetical protein